MFGSGDISVTTVTIEIGSLPPSVSPVTLTTEKNVKNDDLPSHRSLCEHEQNCTWLELDASSPSVVVCGKSAQYLWFSSLYFKCMKGI